MVGHVIFARLPSGLRCLHLQILPERTEIIVTAEIGHEDDDGEVVTLRKFRIEPALDSLAYAMTFASDRLFAGRGDGRVLFSDDMGESWQRLNLGGDLPDRIQALGAV